MKSRLSTRSALALTIYVAMVTSLCAPLAYYAGKARGENLASASLDPSQIETDTAPDYASLVKAQRAGARCGGAGDPGVERRGLWEVFCHPYQPGEAPGGGDLVAQNHLAAPERPRILARSAPRQGDAPLQKAMIRALSQGDGAGVGPADPYPGDPFALAMAPGLAPGGSGLGPGTVPPAGGFPGVLIPGYGGLPATPPISGPPDGPPSGPPSGPPVGPPSGPPSGPPTGPPTGPPEPPVLVTPLPGALPLMLAGLGGIIAATRRRPR